MKFDQLMCGDSGDAGWSERHLKLSVRRAGRLVGLSRVAIEAPTSRHDKDKPIVEAMARMVHERLRDEGFEVGRDQVYRLCRKPGFKVPRRRRKKRAIGVTKNAVHAQAATRMPCPDYGQTKSMRRIRGLLAFQSQYLSAPRKNNAIPIATGAKTSTAPVTWAWPSANSL